MKRGMVVIFTALIATAVLPLAGFFYDQYDKEEETFNASTVPASDLIRPHSPVIGRPDAPVTIVEFFDPACEACRAFYPVVKQILAKYPKDVRVVIRYTPLHQGSDTVVRILETARIQNLFEPVLEALLEMQPAWAVHGSPNQNKAWEAARGAGLDVERARSDMSRPEIEEALRQDIADFKAAKVKGTPTFFVNAKPLPSFGVQQLQDFVRNEVERVGGSR